MNLGTMWVFGGGRFGPKILRPQTCIPFETKDTGGLFILHSLKVREEVMFFFLLPTKLCHLLNTDMKRSAV